VGQPETCTPHSARIGEAATTAFKCQHISEPRSQRCTSRAVRRHGSGPSTISSVPDLIIPEGVSVPGRWARLGWLDVRWEPCTAGASGPGLGVGGQRSRGLKQSHATRRPDCRKALCNTQSLLPHGLSSRELSSPDYHCTSSGWDLYHRLAGSLDLDPSYTGCTNAKIGVYSGVDSFY
jgi:hypothetical protein